MSSSPNSSSTVASPNSSPTTNTKNKVSKVAIPSFRRANYDKLYTERLNSSDEFEPPWPDNIAQKGLLDVLKWKAKSSAPSFPTKEEATRMVGVTEVDKLKLHCYPQQQEQQQADSSTDGNAASAAAAASSTNKKSHLQQHLLATWIGHATYLVQTDHCNVLTDPIWSKRASYVSFAGPKRMLNAPIPIDQLPWIDVVTISHSHLDHCDTDTIMQLHDLYKPIFVVPRGLKTRWFTTLGWPEEDVKFRVVELGWYETTEIIVTSSRPSSSSFSSLTMASSSSSSKDDDVNNSEGNTATAATQSIVHVTPVPVQHWTMRTPMDRNKTLWSGMVVETFRYCSSDDDDEKTGSSSSSSSDSKKKKLVARWFHDGDTGYHEKIFKQIGAEFGETEASAAAGSIMPSTRDEEESQQELGVVAAEGTAAAAAAAVTAASTTSCSGEGVCDSSAQPQRNQRLQDHHNNCKKPPVFDLALLPIGAYEPRWFMRQQHINPDDAMQIFLDLGSPKVGLAMHWGTFVLTDEPIDEPPKALAEARKKYNVPDSAFYHIKQGQTVEVPLRA